MRSERTRINGGEKGVPVGRGGLLPLPSPSHRTRNARRRKNPRTRHSRPSLETLRPRTKLRVDPPYDPPLLLNLPCNFRSSSTGPACVSLFHYTVFSPLLLLLLLLFRLIIRCDSRCRGIFATTVDPLFVRNVGVVAREKERHPSLPPSLRR